MAQPPPRLPAHGPWAPPLLRLLQPFALPQTFYPPGSAPLCPLPGQEQPFPTSWAPPAGGAAPAPQAPPAGLQRAPCGCCFDPRVFCVQWTVPYNHQGAAVAPAPPVLPTPIPGYRYLEGHLARLNISSKASAAGTPRGSHGPPSCSAAPHNEAAGDPRSPLAVPEKVLLEDALKLFGCCVDTEGVSKDDLSSLPKADEPGGTTTAPPLNFSSLGLPQDLLTPNYSVPETRAAFLSMEELYILGMEPPGLWGAGTELLPPQAAPAEPRGHKREHKRGHSPLPEPPSKRRGWVGGGD